MRRMRSNKFSSFWFVDNWFLLLIQLSQHFIN